MAMNHLSDIKFQDFMKPFKDYNIESYSFLMNHTTIPLDNPLGFRKNLL